MFEDFLAGLDDDRRAAMAAVVEQVAALVPDAEEGRSYGMPAFRLRGRPLLGMQEAKAHLSLHPFSTDAVDVVRADLPERDVSKGTVRFTPQQPLPGIVVERMVRARLAKLDGA